MLLLVLLCVLVAIAMLVLAVAVGAAGWAWGSVVACLVAGGLLATDFVTRRKRDRQAADPAAGRVATGPPTPAPAASRGQPTPPSPPHGGPAAGGPGGQGAPAPVGAEPPGRGGPPGPPGPQGLQGPPPWAAVPQGGPVGPPGHPGPVPPYGMPPGDGRGRPGMPPVVLPRASASGRLSREPSRVPGAPAGSRFLGMVPLPGTPAATRGPLSYGPGPQGPGGPLGRPPHRSAPAPSIDPATTQFDPAQLRHAASAAPEGEAAGAGRATSPPFPPAAGAPSGSTAVGASNGADRGERSSSPGQGSAPGQGAMPPMPAMGHGSPPDPAGPGTPPGAGTAAGQGVPPGQNGPPGQGPPATAPSGEPDEESVDARRTEVVSRLEVEVLVIDEEPLFHLEQCRYPQSRDVIPLPVSEALSLGFAGCSWCTPVAALAARHSSDSQAADSRR